MGAWQTAFVLGCVIVIAVYIGRPKGQGSAGSLPPGPKGMPIIGSALSLPNQHLATYLTKLCEQYGGLISLRLFRQTMIVIADAELAHQLLEKRASCYSSRSPMLYFSKYIDPSSTYWGFHRQGKPFEAGRRLTTQIMAQQVRTGKTEPLQTMEARLTCIQLLEDATGESLTKWTRLIHRFSISLTSAATFGVRFPRGDEQQLLDLVQVANELTHFATQLGSGSIIDVFPCLDWIPGPMPWRRIARKFRKEEDRVFGSLIREALEGQGKGVATWTSVFAHPTRRETENTLRFVRQFTAAAVETTSLTIKNFVLACIIHPEIVSVARRQLDAVVGSERLPSFADRPNLPYIEACLREVLRWKVGVPFGIPHACTQADLVTYRGKEYFIPNKSIVIALAGVIEQDPSRFPDPTMFRPERWLEKDGTLKENYATTTFGYGRRVCPGSPFAERSIWIMIAMLLWGIDIKPGKDLDPETGKPIECHLGDSAFIGKFATSAKPFPAIFKARSAHHIEVMKREHDDADNSLAALLPGGL